ncbi:TIGR04283 family arsenosugar biosynthesis glycosyltransferase [Psychroflexus tropicus]|uniref:TIGR04283 family arsenosugar biosynthesis glycosyltransferase n=1 Tax=Psychroflexus tropicus TaxID=197345 RepID=UPI00037CF919|nr:TIGR04283 family arsenosugar biosynthesis glycosyltransferase [Psychroflexus tropicus]
MLISIIIPALNEEKVIAEVLEHTLWLQGHSEIIVVDGGSQDQTLELAKSFEKVNVLQSSKGRAAQMNYGASKATGDIFLFLHADTYLPKTYYNDVNKLLQNTEIVAGSFKLKMDNPHPIFKFYQWCSQFNLEFFTYGDHGMFMKAEAFKTIGGFKPIPFMEDVEIQKRLRQLGKLKKTKSYVTTSSRRFQKNGVITQLIIDTLLVLGFKLGISPNRLKRFYPDH